MAAGRTYTPIATTTISGTTTNSITFSSISGSYTDLILIFSGGVISGGQGRIQFNSDTGTNYSRTVLKGDGTTASSGRNTNSDRIDFAQAGQFNDGISTNVIVNIMNYSNTTTYKTILSRFNSIGSIPEVNAEIGLWRNISAITSIKFYTDVNFNSGSTFTLYGIAAA